MNDFLNYQIGDHVKLQIKSDEWKEGYVTYFSNKDVNSNHDDKHKKIHIKIKNFYEDKSYSINEHYKTFDQKIKIINQYPYRQKYDVGDIMYVIQTIDNFEDPDYHANYFEKYFKYGNLYYRKAYISHTYGSVFCDNSSFFVENNQIIDFTKIQVSSQCFSIIDCETGEYLHIENKNNNKLIFNSEHDAKFYILKSQLNSCINLAQYYNNEIKILSDKLKELQKEDQNESEH